MSLLVGLEAQPDFPRADLTDANAALLELVLANNREVATAHQLAEWAVWLYQLSHPAVQQAGQRVAAIEPHLPAFSHGVSAYEAIAALVQAAPAEADQLAVRANALSLGSGLAEAALFGYVDDASEQFKLVMPRTAKVVQTSAERLQHDVAGYAIIGAAVARQFELDAA